MLLPDNTRPDLCIYYLASFVLKVMLEKRASDYASLYTATEELHDISPSSFALCLDWLYLSGTIDIDKDGRFYLC